MVEFEWLKGQLAELSGYVREKYASRSTVHIETKLDASDLLTEVDLTVQRLLSEAILERFPEDIVVAEESGQHRYPENPDARCWVIDPIDGTQNFVRGFFPIFGISAAFAQNGVPQCAIVDVPMPGWSFEAVAGAGATRNGVPLRVSTIPDAGDARIEVDFGSRPKREGSLARFDTLLREAGALRCYGSAALGLCAVASGDSDVYLNVALSPWDYAAGILLVTEAGGQATRPDGQAIHLFGDDQGIVATNGHLHKQVVGRVTG